MKKNKEILKNLFHVINFLYFARDNFSLIKNKKIKEKKLKQISMLEDWSSDLQKKYIQNSNHLTENEIKKFFVMYQTCSLIYDLNFKELVDGKEFHLQFDYSQLKNEKN